MTNKQVSTPAPGYSRIQILGLDVLIVKTQAVLRALQQSGHIDRLSATNISAVPWPFRLFMSSSRFYFPSLSVWFQAMRPKSDPTYAPCRAFLDEKFAVPHDMQNYAKTAADLLLSGKATDKQLFDVSAHAIWQYMIPAGHPAIPESIIDDTMRQIGGITESLNPIKLALSRKPTNRVFNYAETTLNETNQRGDLPNEIVADVGHCFFAVDLNVPRLLREIARVPNDSIDNMLVRLGLVPSTLRIAVSDSTLGGVLPTDNPAKKFGTIIILNIADMARETNDPFFSFAVDSDRRCAAEGVIRQFVQAVQIEIRNRTL